MPDQTSAARKWYERFVKWSRRIIAVLVVFLVARWLRGGSNPATEVERWFTPISGYLAPISPARMAVASVTIWYAFLTQLQLRWAMWLPIYFFVYPLLFSAKVIAKVLGILLKFLGKTAVFAAGPFIRQIESLGAGEATSTVPKSSRSIRSFPTKRVWLLLFFLWFVAFRGLGIWWAAWIAPALAVPVWIFCLRTAYRLAVAPKSLVTFVAAACSRFLDNQLKTVSEAKDKNTKVQPSTILYDLINKILQRYSADRMHSVVQRESTLMFSIALALALVASSWFWALIGLAALEVNPQALDGYNFFATGSFTEALVWAWGCMTTAISFPARVSPTWLKVAHALMVATGLFQLTFLLACFSIMTNSETSRAVTEAAKMLTETREKLEKTRALETTVIEAQAVVEGEVLMGAGSKSTSDAPSASDSGATEMGPPRG